MKEGVKEKIFINIVSSDKIMKPSKQVAKDGTHWSLPYSLGPPHMEKDNSGNNSAAFDCCFHPECIMLSVGPKGTVNKAFRDLLVRTAMEGVEESYRRQNQNVTLINDYHVLKGVSYKSGQPPAMMIDKGSKQNWKDDVGSADTAPSVDEIKKALGGAKASSSTNSNSNSSSNIPNKPTQGKGGATKAQAPAVVPSAPVSSKSQVKTGAAAKPPAAPAIKKGFLSKQMEKDKPPPLISEVTPATARSSSSSTATTTKQDEAVASRGKANSSSNNDNSIVNNSGQQVDSHKLLNGGIYYTVLERGITSMGDFDNPNLITVQSNRPKELVYKFDVPAVVKASLLELDVSEKNLKLKYKDVYNLDIDVRYPVDDKKGTAKYDKGPKRLTVTLPVKPDKTLPRQVDVPMKNDVTDISPSSNENTLNGPEGSKQSDDDGDERLPVEPTAKSKAKLEKDKEKGHDKWVNRDALRDKEAEAQKLKQEIQSKMEEAAKLARKAQHANENVDELTQQLNTEEAKLEEARKEVDSSIAAIDSDNKKNENRKHVTFANPDDILIDDSGEIDFIEASVYRGMRKGYVFKKDAKGLGYYKDICAEKMAKVEEDRVKTAKALVKQGDMNKDNETSYLQGIFNTRKNVYRLKSGILVEKLIISSKSNPKSPKFHDSCRVSYTGWLALGGAKFDANTTTFTPSQVIKGWTECLQLMVEGDKWKIHVPSKLAYGPAGSPPLIPPHAVLVFDIELLKITNEEGGKTQHDAKEKFTSSLEDVSSPSSSSILSATMEKFEYEYRQTKAALSMIISVPNIVTSSVNIKFHIKGCDVCFKDNNNKMYGMGFDVSKELNLDKCSYDVASNNMVVIFAKSESQLTIWLEDEDSKGHGKVLMSRDINQGVFVTDENNGSNIASDINENDRSHEKSSSAANIIEDEIKKVSGKIDELKFQSAEFIYELD